MMGEWREEEEDVPVSRRRRPGTGRFFRFREMAGAEFAPSSLAISFLIPVISMVVVFIMKGIWPFGDNSFLRTDMYHQYAPFFMEFHDKLRGGESLFYTWDIGLGVNFSALYAYYLASPVNWLLAIWPRSLVIEFMTLQIVIKIGFCGLAFNWYLRRHFDTSDYGTAFFGILYAMSGYIAAYSWNLMWLDCIALFPVVMAGLERLYLEGDGRLYTGALGLSIFSNYYISIMTCIFLVFYYAAMIGLHRGRSGEHPVRNFLRFGGCSLLAGGLGSVVLLPEIFALRMTASGDMTFPKTWEQYFPIMDMLARHLGAVECEEGLDHWPNIYCGIMVLMLVILYFGSETISRRRKTVYGLLLLFFLASFSINIFNYIWHGFHYPNSLPARQSYIYIALLLVMCCEAWLSLDKLPEKRITMAFGGAVVFVLAAQKMCTDDGLHFAIFYAAILILGIYTLIFMAFRRKRFPAVLLICFMLTALTLETTANMAITSVPTTTRSTYLGDNAAIRSLGARAREDGQFYRIDRAGYRTKDDGAWLHIPTASIFSSMASAHVTDFYKDVGCEGSTNAYSINGSTPLVDSLLAVKYEIIQEEDNAKDLILAGSSGDIYLYEKPETLPLGLVLSPGFEEGWNRTLSSPVNVQNNFCRNLGLPDVLTEKFSEVNKQKLTFTAVNEGYYYIDFTDGKTKKVSMKAGDRSKTVDNLTRGFLLETGWLNEGDQVTVEVKDPSSGTPEASVYYFEPSVMTGVYEALSRETMELRELSASRVRGTVSVSGQSVLWLQIPYDKSWRITVDGKETESVEIFGAFLSVPLSPGTHEISLRFVPEGLVPGAAISGAAVVLFLLMLLCGRKRRKPYKTQVCETERAEL